MSSVFDKTRLCPGLFPFLKLFLHKKNLTFCQVFGTVFIFAGEALTYQIIAFRFPLSAFRFPLSAYFRYRSFRVRTTTAVGEEVASWGML